MPEVSFSLVDGVGFQDSMEGSLFSFLDTKGVLIGSDADELGPLMTWVDH